MFCVYMPCDNNSIGSLHVYVDTLTQMSAICSKYNAEYICIGGDMNTDLTRLHSQNTLSLNNYVVTEELKFALHHSISSVVHTFSSFSTSSFSILDHFIVNEFLFNRIQCYVTCDDIENQSDHLPLLITLDIDISIVNDVVINPPSTVRVPRQQWDRADITDRANYHDYLDNLLMSLHLPIHSLTLIPVELIHAGWNDFVKSFQSEALDWHSIWISSGRPQSGFVCDMRRSSRKAYHKQVDFVFVLKRESKINGVKIAESFLKSDSRDFWKECDKLRGRKTCPITTVEGFTDSDDIADAFSNHYNELYNSVDYDEDGMNEVRLQRLG